MAMEEYMDKTTTGYFSRRAPKRPRSHVLKEPPPSAGELVLHMVWNRMSFLGKMAGNKAYSSGLACWENALSVPRRRIKKLVVHPFALLRNAEWCLLTCYFSVERKSIAYNDFQTSIGSAITICKNFEMLFFLFF